MTSIEDVLLYSLTQKGDPYIFGAEALASDPNPDAFDCSELVEWSCHRAGIADCPDGAYNQWIWSRGRALSVDLGMKTRGALLFVGDGTGIGRDAINHVAWSLGDGTTIEARGSRWGVGTWPSVGRFDYAARIPGATYPPVSTPAPQPSPSHEEVDMLIITCTGKPARLLAPPTCAVINGATVKNLKAAGVKTVAYEADDYDRLLKHVEDALGR